MNNGQITYYPFTRSQKTIAIQEKYSLHKGMMQIPIMLYFDRPMELELLKKAINTEIERNDCLRVRFIKQKDCSYQYFVPPFEIDNVVFSDFTGKTKKAQDDFITKRAKTPLDYYGGLFGNFTLIKSYDGRYGLLAVLNHLNMDAWGVFLMLSDLFTVYDALETEAELPSPLASYEECLKKELTYSEKDAENDENALVEYYSQNGGTDYSRIIDYRCELPDAQRKRAMNKKANRQLAALKSLFHDKSRCLTLEFDSDLVKRITDFCVAQSVTVNNFFAFALRTYLSKINNSDDVMYSSLCNRRGTVAEKKSGGCRVSAAYMRSIIPPETSFKDTVTQLDAIQRKLYRHLNYGALDTTMLLTKKFNTSGCVEGGSLMFTLMPLELHLPKGFECDINWISSGYVSSSLYLFTLPGSNGAMKLNYEFRVYDTCDEQIISMHNMMIKIFNIVMENPDIIVADILAKI